MKPYQLPKKIIVDQVPLVLKQISKELTVIDGTSFDLSQLTTIDSAGIALLAYLKSNYKGINFLNPTTQIANLCQLYKIQL